MDALHKQTAPHAANLARWARPRRVAFVTSRIKHFVLNSIFLPERMDILAQMGLRELVPYTMRLPADSLCDLNRRLDEQQPKPQLSYIGLIAMAILSSREKKMILSEVYQWITDNYPYFRSRGPGWRNSIRHNLSLNDCFIKAGRSANGKGHYWAIHPANIEDFQKGDFRRRRAQRKVRRHMGLSVNEDECSDDSPIASPVPPRKSFSVESILQRDVTPRWLVPMIPPVVSTGFPFQLFTPHY